MIVRFSDKEGNIFLVPTDNITCCILYVCDDDTCSEYYHYNVVIGKIEVEVKREEFVKVFHHLEDRPLSREQLAVIPEQKCKNTKEVKTNESTS